MKRVVAEYEDADDASAAEADLRDADLEPVRPDVDNRFFDPAARPPEARGLVWGGLVGGVLGTVLLGAMALDFLWLPRLSPIMTASRLTLLVFGFGLGAAAGGFVGGVWGTYQDIPDPTGPRVAVDAPDDRASDAKERLRAHDPSALDEAVTTHR
ncbi:hypothetical protein ACFR9U_13200 [Halorientalis brevis]|uniref:Uncharacterized protein n=1 Tax=Halorientalis brevis TaxID=1126241 RepID=A0ABD6CDK9_9EURY|nr:hypothetical protein [Halorientalis brevis]